MDPEELLNEHSNEEKKNESPLLSLERDLRIYSESIHEVAIEIMVEGLSSYPIFIAYQHLVSVGELILDRDDLNMDWSINASTLEEFIDKGIIRKELKDRFLKTYKNAHDHMCLFVIVPEGANFVYYPYKKG